MPPTAQRLLRHGDALLAIVLVTAYAVTFSPGATWNDGPEIVTAIANLGIIHPTGYPLFTMAAHLFTWLPFPLATFVKVELFNAVCCAAAAVITARAVREVYATVEPEPEHPDLVRIGSLTAGLALGLSPLLWAQVRIAEVYPFHVLLVSAGGYAWIRFIASRERKYVLWAALFMGMGLSHHVTMVYMLVASAVILLTLDWRFFLSRYFPLACLLGFLPMLSYLYLMWAAENTAALPWGGPTDWEKLYHHMSGGQYRRFLGAKDWAHYFARIKKVPVTFDKQFLAPGTIAFFVGLGALFTRAPKQGAFLVGYMLLNVAHGVYYSVGDYHTYFLPGVFCCSVIIGTGAAFGLGWIARRNETTPVKAAGLVWVMVAGSAVCVYAYGRWGAPMDEGLKRFLMRQTTWVLLGATAVVTLGAIAVRLGKLLEDAEIESRRLALVVAVGGLVGFTGVASARAYDFTTKRIIAMGFAGELASLIPKGSVLLLQGDGQLFSMWHEQHVLGRGTDIAVVDLGNIRTPWYVEYLESRHPAACDPIYGDFAEDEAAYQEHCSTYEKRKARQEKKSWLLMRLPHGGKPKKGKPYPGEIRRGADAKCATDEAWAKEHEKKECRCTKYREQPGADEQHCVFSYQEDGIVVRHDKEILWQRFVEDHIDKRPIYERNALLHWVGAKSENYRGWSGPHYQRPSKRYAFLNRGRYNQIVYTSDLLRTEGCAETLSRPPLREPNPKKRRPWRRAPYQPNDFPTVISGTFLTAKTDEHDDHATRDFSAGSDIVVQFDWFEQFEWSWEAKGHRGEKIRQGIRLCLYGPDEKRLATRVLVSGDKDKPVFPTTPESPEGRYHLQGCSLGLLAKDQAPSDDLPCERVVLDFDLALRK